MKETKENIVGTEGKGKGRDIESKRDKIQMKSGDGAISESACVAQNKTISAPRRSDRLHVAVAESSGKGDKENADKSAGSTKENLLQKLEAAKKKAKKGRS